MLEKFGPSIYIPVADYSGTITGGYLRSLEGRGHLTDLGTSPFMWFGNFKERPPVIFMAEGPLDAAAISRAGGCCLSICTSAVNSYQIEWLRALSCVWNFIVLFIHDNDDQDQGKKGAELTIKRLSYLNIKGVMYSTPFGAGDPGDLYGESAFEKWIQSWIKIYTEKINANLC